MIDSMPPELSELSSVLINTYGLSVVRDELYVESGCRTIVFATDGLALRFLLDRGQWTIDAAKSSESSQWYYTALVRETVHHIPVGHAMSLTEKIAYWQRHLAEVLEYFRVHRASVESIFYSNAKAICRRENPGWFRD
jgi:hypothetical protein